MPNVDNNTFVPSVVMLSVIVPFLPKLHDYLKYFLLNLQI
jgi:hypothetical protein